MNRRRVEVSRSVVCQSESPRLRETSSSCGKISGLRFADLQLHEQADDRILFHVLIIKHDIPVRYLTVPSPVVPREKNNAGENAGRPTRTAADTVSLGQYESLQGRRPFQSISHHVVSKMLEKRLVTPRVDHAGDADNEQVTIATNVRLHKTTGHMFQDRREANNFSTQSWHQSCLRCCQIQSLHQRQSQGEDGRKIACQSS